MAILKNKCSYFRRNQGNLWLDDLILHYNFEWGIVKRMKQNRHRTRTIRVRFIKCRTICENRKITNYIWNKDYQGLFDYDAKTLDKKVVKVNGNAMVGKTQGNFVFMGDDPSKMPE